MTKELVFTNPEAAFEVAKLLLDECYVVMLSREEALYILNFQYSENCDRNDVVFMSRDDFEEKYVLSRNMKQIFHGNICGAQEG